MLKLMLDRSVYCICNSFCQIDFWYLGFLTGLALNRTFSYYFLSKNA